MSFKKQAAERLGKPFRLVITGARSGGRDSADVILPCGNRSVVGIAVDLAATEVEETAAPLSREAKDVPRADDICFDRLQRELPINNRRRDAGGVDDELGARAMEVDRGAVDESEIGAASEFGNPVCSARHKCVNARYRARPLEQRVVRERQGMTNVRPEKPRASSDKQPGTLQQLKRAFGTPDDLPHIVGRRRERYHTFQGARPLAHSSSRIRFSRIVSIANQ